MIEKIKAFFKRPKPEAKAAEKKAAEPSKTKVAEAPEKKGGVAQSRKRALPGETRVLWSLPPPA